MKNAITVYITVRQYKDFIKKTDIWAWIEKPFLQEPIITLTVSTELVCEVTEDGYAYVIGGEQCKDCGKEVEK